MSATRLLARYRVALGGLMAALTVWLARPTARSVVLGLGLIVAGEWLRVWAAGHVEKSREVTSSGPYRYTRHPLYLGSTLLGLGFAVAANHLWLGLAVVAYLVATLGAAIRAEEAHLREKFGAAYDAYAARRLPPSPRRFSWARALANREHHAAAGALAGLSLLVLKVWYSQGFVGR
ncbi:MAG: isoprenylcysteine carboxylmethyltransferase family protein [Vicinamibacterales bacterium]